MASSVDVDALELQVDLRMADLNKHMIDCAALSTTDATAWSSFYLSWKAISDYWRILQQDRLNWLAPINTVEESLISDSIYSQMSTYDKQMGTWVTKLNAACPGSYTPPPDVVSNPTPPSKGPNAAELTQYAITGVIAVASAAVLYKGIELVRDFTSRQKA